MEAGHLETEVAMRHYRDSLVQTVAIFHGGVDKEDRAGRDSGRHGIAGQVHADHLLRVRTPAQRREQYIFDFDFREADIFMRRNAVAVGGDLEQRNGDRVALSGEMVREIPRSDEVKVSEIDTE